MLSDPIVITGLGAVTPIGAGVDALWQGLLEGRHGFGPVRSFDTSAYPVHVGAEVHDFEPERWLQSLGPQGVGRATQLAIAAARMAVADAALDLAALDATRVGVAMGTTSGEPREVEQLNDLYLDGRLEALGDEFIGRYPSHLIPAFVAVELGLQGPNTLLPAACAAGNYALAHALDQLRDGEVDLMLAGGSDAFSRITYTGFARLRAIAPEVVQPFDKGRKGMIPGEGAAMLVLERASSARARGARIWAEVAGYGLSCDAHHMTAAHPEGAGAARAMEVALETSGIGREEVSWISAHGTGTPTNDRLETAAVRRVFGDAADGVPISSIKGNLGHTMGAASAIEAVVCALAIHHQTVPPTLNYREPDPQCDLDCVPEGPRRMPVRVAMSNAYAFGGNNASVIFRRVPGPVEASA
ncbi:MAG: beta-ketoacyl-[acyl-carrier-protein] synthase family protein [Acidobacteria bacterium]|nr:MAG: beta-ketoacyl-[acyl-carrier-protein] synthase family protein [Acidobacteriota bacterium]REK08753.1 MAG: beta-ketoacyl-[acyl-carrier-protein] synthase family protein [Acidobacteriota bacterium]